MLGPGARLASTTVSEAATKVPVADRLEGDDLDRWQACVQMVRSQSPVTLHGIHRMRSNSASTIVIG